MGKLMGWEFSLSKPTSQTYTMSAIRAPVTIALASGEGESGPPTFESIAYSGAVVPGDTSTPRLDADYVIDLSGMTAHKNAKVNLDHKSNQRVGHLTDVHVGTSDVKVSGLLSAVTPYRDEVAGNSKNGYPWEVSIEGNLSKPRKLASGKSAVVNGRTVDGPLYIFGKSVLTAVAFVSQGADDGNSVTIAASAAKDVAMNEFEEYCVSLGVDLESVTTDQKARLQTAFNATKAAPPDVTRSSFDLEADEVRRETDRQNAIRQIALEAMKEFQPYQDQIRRLAKAALESPSTRVKDFELELLRTTRTSAGRFQLGDSGARAAEMDPEVIQAAICLSAGLPNVETAFSEQTLHAVDRSGMRNFSLQQLFMRVAHANGYPCRVGDRIHIGNIRTVLEYCFPRGPVRTDLTAGFSTVNLPGILGAVANKELLAGYMEEDQTWREISTIKSVTNFHVMNSYRMLDNLEYEEIGPAGEIKHGTLSQETYTRQAKTYAKLLALTRTDIINDDLGAFDDLRARLGRGAAQKFNNIFWAAFMNNASFFTTALTNYIEGATTNLLVDGVGLQQGITAFRKMRTAEADGSKRVGASMSSPTMLLVPPELEFVAARLFQSTNVNAGGAATSEFIPSANIFAGRYRPIVQNRLSDTAFTGNSTTAWYLFGNMLKPMVVSLLNGMAAPIVESTDADFEVLGVVFRAYSDFGADKAEYLSGVKSKGAA